MKISIQIKSGGLKANRELAGISQGELARRTGISVRVIQDYEQGRRIIDNAKLSTILRICNALDCELSAILTDPETLELLETYEENR